MSSMKEINKTHWTTRLIELIYSKWKPKNTCEYHAYLFLAMLIVPFYWYGIYTLYSFKFLDKPEAEFKEKNHTKWSNTVDSLIVFAAIALVSTLTVLINFIIIEKFNAEAVKTSLTNGDFWICLCLTCFIGPIIAKGLNHIYQKIKSKLCKPIKFV
jgi:fatty acid desaturase